MIDYFLDEIELTKRIFNLDEILTFQLEHDVQIIRGEDYQYLCYIDNAGYGTALTPMLALAYGIKCFKEKHDIVEEFEYQGYMGKEAEKFFEGKTIREERDGIAVVGTFIILANGKTCLPSKGDLFRKNANGDINVTFKHER